MEKEKEKTEKSKKNTGYVITIILLLLVICVLGGYIAYDKLLSDNKTDNKETTTTAATATKKNTNTIKEVEIAKDNTQYYLWEGYGTNRRYFLAFDNADKLGSDNGPIDSRKKEVYLIDMNMASEKHITKLDFTSLIKGVYDAKINSLPDVLAPGTVNQTNKSDCVDYLVQYSADLDAYMSDGSKEVPFKISYSCINGTDGGQLSLGTERYVLDVENMIVK